MFSDKGIDIVTDLKMLLVIPILPIPKASGCEIVPPRTTQTIPLVDELNPRRINSEQAN